MENLPKKMSFLNKIKNAIYKKFGYREGEKFIIDTKPTFKKYTQIELMKVASIEEKLRRALESNANSEVLKAGISEEEAKSLLEWVVQNAREGFMVQPEEYKYREFNIFEESLSGCCGLGQGITAYTLINMGLSPDVVNVSQVMEKRCGHSLLIVDIPIQQENIAQNKSYLVDTTFRQFFTRDESTNSRREYIKDKRFGNRVASQPGYWMLQMKNGEELARQILESGFVELTEENAKMYGDCFVLSEKERRDPTKVPSKKELQLPTTGWQYIQNIKNPQLQQEIDYTEEELEGYKINIKTPLMQKLEMNLSEKEQPEETKEQCTEKNKEENESEQEI